MFYPFGDFPERPCIKPARSPLSIAPARDQSRAFEYLEVFGDGRHAHLEWLGKLSYGSFTRSESSKYRPPCWIGEGVEGGFGGICNRLVPHNA